MQALKNIILSFQGLLVAAILLGMMGLIWALRQSDIYVLLHHHDAARMVILEGKMPAKNFETATTFLPHLQQQLISIDNCYNPNKALCLQNFSRPDSAIAAIHNLWAITTVSNLQCISNHATTPETFTVVLTLNTASPFNITYFFSKRKQADIALDSIAGIDSLLWHFYDAKPL